MATIVLRRGVEIEDPLGLVIAFVEAYSAYDAGGVARPGSFDERDLRLANRGGARISAAEIAAVLERSSAIERALHRIGVGASLVDADGAIPWAPLTQLFDAFSGIRGVGFSKMTKTLHRKRPALIPMLDSVVLDYLAGDDPLPEPFAERAIALVRGFKQDVDRNRAPLRGLRRKLAARGHELTEVRILDILVWSAFVPK